MPRILLTAFEPYDRWPENSSWLALIEFTKQLNRHDQITTRLYPVDFTTFRQRLENDLAADFDYALHLGQSPGSTKLRLEAIGVNVSCESQQSADQVCPLVPDGPVAYRSQLPLARWAEMLRSAGIPAAVSHHAGIYLCNATLYLSHYLAEKNNLQTRSTFIHVPLDSSQAAQENGECAALPSAVCATALRLIVETLVKPGPPADSRPA